MVLLLLRSCASSGRRSGSGPERFFAAPPPPPLPGPALRLWSKRGVSLLLLLLLFSSGRRSGFGLKRVSSRLFSSSSPRAGASALVPREFLFRSPSSKGQGKARQEGRRKERRSEDKRRGKQRRRVQKKDTCILSRFDDRHCYHARKIDYSRGFLLPKTRYEDEWGLHEPLSDMHSTILCLRRV